MFIIDLNSIVMASLMVGKDPDAYESEGMQIRTADYGWTNFTKSFLKALEDFELAPHEVIGVFDAPKSRKRRQRIYPAYKEHREKRPEAFYEELNTLMSDVKQFMKDLGCIICWSKGTEADDVIAHIAPKIDGAIIWSKDNDLLSIGTDMYMHGLHGGVFINETCDHKFLGLKRKYVRLHRTLLNDTGDFGPGMGAKGFGEAAFKNMWLEFGEAGFDNLIDMIEREALDELQDDVADFKPLQKIIDSAKTVYLTWKLAGWLTVLDHKLKWEGGVARGKHVESYDQDFDRWYGKQTLITDDNYLKMLPLILQHIDEAPYIPFDIEADVEPESQVWLDEMKKHIDKPPFIDVHGQKITGCSITAGDNLQHTYYFSIDHKDTANISMDVIGCLLKGITKYIVAHNSNGYEITVSYANFGFWLPPTIDNMIAASYVDENSYSKGLKPLAKNWLEYIQVSYEEVTQGRGMRELTGKEVLSYGCDDTITTGHLFNLFTVIMQVEGSYDAFMKVELSPQYMSASAFYHGINFDPEVLVELDAADKVTYDEKFEEINKFLIEIEYPGTVFEELTELNPSEIKRGYYMITGEPLTTRFRVLKKVAEVIRAELPVFADLVEGENLEGCNEYIEQNFTPKPDFKVKSPKKMNELVYEIFAFPIRYRNKLTKAQKLAGRKQGNPSTDEDAVKWMIHADANEDQKIFLENVLRCKAYLTRKGLYYEPYQYLAHWSDGKLRPSLRQSATDTRRYAPSGPNVNQMPKNSSPEGKKIRRCIIPHHKDAVLVAVDWSGQELRLIAEASQDAAFLSCYVGDDLKDLHSLTGFNIDQHQDKNYANYESFSKAIENEETKAKKSRADGKSTNFLSNYAGSAFTLSKKLRIPESDAQTFLDAKNSAFPTLETFTIESQKDILDKKYVTTMLGARRHLYKPLMFGEEGHVLRSGFNFQIQSSGSEMVKIALGKVWTTGMLDRFDVHFLTPIHDEVLFSVSKSDLVGFCKELRPIMEAGYADCTVPFESTLSVGHNFGQLEEIKWEEVAGFNHTI